jgi:hypothetical protein
MQASIWSDADAAIYSGRNNHLSQASQELASGHVLQGRRAEDADTESEPVEVMFHHVYSAEQGQ